MGACIGIDVSKHALDWTVGSAGRIERTANQPRAIGQLVRRLIAQSPSRIVIESTGGYERNLVLKLAEARLPVVVVNPRRVRKFGEGMGILAKTDAIDARLLALFGEKAELPLRPIAQGLDRLLADLVARRRQLVSMIVAEKNRRDRAAAPVRRSIDALLRTLERHLRDLDQRIQKQIAADPERAELAELLQTVPGPGRPALQEPRRSPGRVVVEVGTLLHLAAGVREGRRVGRQDVRGHQALDRDTSQGTRRRRPRARGARGPSRPAVDREVREARARDDSLGAQAAAREEGRMNEPPGSRRTFGRSPRLPC